MVVLLYPGDEAAVEQITGLEDMGQWEAVFGLIYGEGAEFRLWLAMFIFSFIGIFFVGVPALAGTSVIAKDIDNKTIDLLLSNPLQKRRVLLEKTIAVVLLSIFAIFYVYVATLVMSYLIGQKILLDILFAACLQIFTLVLFVTLLGIFLAVLFRDMNRARRYIAIIILGSFVINMIVLFSEEMEPLKYFQIFYYYDSPSTLLKPDLGEVSWEKSNYLIIFSVILFVLTYIINEQIEIFPHYSHKVVDKRKKDRGIPILFFYLKRYQSRYPSLVEQIQSDRLVFYIFAGVLLLSGILTPGMYPGDEGWVGLSKTYSGNILTEALLRNHEIAQSFIGYFSAEGIGEYFIYMGIVAMIWGSKIVVRDQRSNTVDLIISQPIQIENVLKQRKMAIALEYLTLFGLNYFGYIIGIYISGYGQEYLFTIAVVLFFTCLVCILMTYLLTTVTLLFRNINRATGIAALTYYTVLIVYMVAYSIGQIQILSRITPFYWSDRVRILYDNNIILQDFLAFTAYLVSIIAISLLNLRLIRYREYYQ